MEIASKRHDVQNLVVGRSHVERAICYSFETLEGHPALFSATDQTIETFGDTRLRFDKILNAFSENYWRLVSDFSSIFLTVRYSGAPTISIWRDVRMETGETTRVLLIARQLDPSRDVDTFEIAMQQPNGRDGLVSFSLESTEPFRFEGGAWGIDAAPIREVGLALVTCTLNYAGLMPTFFEGIEENLKDPLVGPRVSKVVVVNNGPSTFDPDLAALTPRVAERLLVITQENAGASGGFARGILAARDDPATTHIGLHDDDAILVSGALAKACAVLGYASDKQSLGGQMLDLAQPYNLLASGQFFDQATSELLNPVLNTDLRQESWKTPFLERHLGDWNGWWFAIFPRETFDAVGYPLPLFVKWDDVEFGVRASRAGYQNITFPGVGVWHEAPDMKPVTWQEYFMVRNALIVRALHSKGNGRDRAALRVILSAFLSSFLSYRYYQARLVIEAMRDYRGGPDVLERNVRTHFGHLRGLVSEAPSFETRKVTNVPRTRPAPIGFRWTLLLRAIFWNLMASRSDRPVTRGFASRFTPWPHFKGIDDVHINDPSLDIVIVLRRDRALARSLFSRFAVELFKWFRASRTLRMTWREAAARLTSRVYWEGYFSLPISDDHDVKTISVAKVPGAGDERCRVH